MAPAQAVVRGGIAVDKAPPVVGPLRRQLFQACPVGHRDSPATAPSTASRSGITARSPPT